MLYFKKNKFSIVKIVFIEKYGVKTDKKPHKLGIIYDTN